MNEWKYYNYMNISEFVQKNNILREVNGLWFRYFKELCGCKLSLFNYKNLPNNLTTDIIEQALLFNANLCFYNIKSLGGLVLCRWLPDGNYDIYWRPIKVRLISISGKPLMNNVPYEDIVIIKDNSMDIVPFITINDYIDTLMSIERTLKINVDLLRLPTMFYGNKQQVAQIQQIFKKVANFEPYAVLDKQFMDKLQVQKFDIPYSPLDIYELLSKYRQLAMGSIGIYGADKKRERLVTKEIESENDFVDVMYDEMLRERQTAIDNINKKWGYNIELEERYVTNKEQEADIVAYEAGKVADAEGKSADNVDEKEGDDNE